MLSSRLPDRVCDPRRHQEDRTRSARLAIQCEVNGPYLEGSCTVRVSALAESSCTARETDRRLTFTIVSVADPRNSKTWINPNETSTTAARLSVARSCLTGNMFFA